ncbi:MAG: hypothetical protein HKP61_16005 [Dactylosporangium sp.]|nr:hypothetical protein [Dactylosporangium sp.]NNJ62409.1 hypothetical protein [Dactylosporangium sp.]
MMDRSLWLIPTENPTPAAACVPGRDGIPDSVIGHLLCGDWATSAPSTLGRLARTHWSLPLVAAMFVVALAVGWRLLRRRSWRACAAQARWLEIVPPVTATPAATIGLWRLLATLLPAPRRLTARPSRLVWEVHADPKGMRCGLWLPPGGNPTAVLRLLHRAWPGVRAEQARPPVINPDRPSAGLTLAFTRPEWQPLIDDLPTANRSRHPEVTEPETDRLRAVFDGLASAGRTGGGLLQIHVCRAPRRRLAALRRATTRPDRARRTGGGSLRVVGWFADALRWLIIAALDFLAPGPTLRAGDPRDPYAAELARQARTKYADAPHLLVCVRAITTGATTAAARAAADDVTSGFGLLTAHSRRRRLHRPATAARWRWVPQPAMTLVGVAETAALAGLPAEPAAYGLPAAASRRRPASREVFTTNRPAGETSAANPPTVWSPE